MINKSSPDEIVVACNGSPMVIGLGQGKTFIASETSAFSKYTKSFVALKDGEIGVVRANGSFISSSDFKLFLLLSLTLCLRCRQ